MIDVMHPVKKPMNQCLDPQLWHACAGGMAQVPPTNSKVYYFPQGHAEHANKNVDFNGFSRIPPLIPCRVSSIQYLADTDTDEVYAKIQLIPSRENEFDVEDECGLLLGLDKNEDKEKGNSFAKTLTQSDANNGGGFSVPRYCAETIFPRLDYTAEPPVQTILAKDVHGEIWKFRHIYRGTPRRHLLTTGWSSFVNQKKLVAGDSIVFLRAENGDLCVGVRRAKRDLGGGPQISSGWNTGAANCGASLYRGLSRLLGENGNLFMGNAKNGNGSCDMGLKEPGDSRVESVIEAANLAATGRPFEVFYYPRAGTPEFVVKASVVKVAMRVHWLTGMRFKMAFETEDSSRISWFMGTISSVRVDDPIRWPNSPWRLLEVAWDEPDLLQNVKRVNPWLVELVSQIPAIHLSRFSPPRKRPRLPQPSEFPLGQLFQSNPLSPSSPLCCLPDNISAGIQGARHAQFGFHSSDLQFKQLHFPFEQKSTCFDALSCSFRTRSPARDSKRNNEAKKPAFLLFGQPILTEEQISQGSYMVTGGKRSCNENTGNLSNGSGSGSGVIQNSLPEALSDGEFPRTRNQNLEFDLFKLYS